MEVSKISVGNSSPKDDRTMEQLVASEKATTPLGQLLIALAAETAWSGKYKVYAQLDEKPYLQISHPSFLPSRTLAIREASGIVSVHDVENALRDHFRESKESIEPVVNMLSSKMSGLKEASDMILTDKAKAAIVAVFPEAAGAYRNHALDANDFRGFVLNGDKVRHEQLFFAREMDGEFTRGIARVNMSALTWYCEKASSELDKHRRFWEALAQAFAARELKIPEENLYCEKILAEEKEWLWPRPVGYDPYIIHEILFEQRFVDGRDGLVAVTFGADNLPASVVRREEEVKV